MVTLWQELDLYRTVELKDPEECARYKKGEDADMMYMFLTWCE